MEGSVLSFLKAEWKVSDTGLAHSASSCIEFINFRSPFEAIYDLCLVRNSIVKIGIELVSNSQKENHLADIENNIIKSVSNLFYNIANKNWVWGIF
jgi:hypothetical protein